MADRDPQHPSPDRSERARRIIDGLIAARQQAVDSRRDMATLDVLPAYTRAVLTPTGRAATRAVPADPDHGARQRRIADLEQERLDDYVHVRAVLDELAAADARITELEWELKELRREIDELENMRDD